MKDVKQKKPVQAIRPSATRPVFVYFFTLVVVTSYSLWARWGAWAIAWAILYVLFFGVGIPAPFLTRSWMKKKDLLKHQKVMWLSFAGVWGFLYAVMIFYTGSLLSGAFWATLYYGYPGMILTGLLLWSQGLLKKNPSSKETP